MDEDGGDFRARRRWNLLDLSQRRQLFLMTANNVTTQTQSLKHEARCRKTKMEQNASGLK